MDAILTDSHLDTGIRICILMNVIYCGTKARIGRKSMGREREVRKTVGNDTENSSYKKS